MPKQTPRIITEREEPMTVGEVARLFAVHTSTVARWATEGRLPSFRTPGGHRRFVPAAIRDVYDHMCQDEPEPASKGQ